jgi:hypothetical protein
MRYFFLVLFACLLWSITGTTASAASNVFDGRLVKTEDQSAVYYVGLEGKRHAFPNAQIYFSWFEDFRKVEVISDFEMALYPLGKNVLYRPGSRLVKIAEVPEVYTVEPGGQLRNIPSEAVAIALYGAQWSKKVDDLDISFFFDYSIAGVVEVVDERALYPRGTVINFDGTNFLTDRRTDGVFLFRPITDEAWELNGFDRLERQTVTDYSLREFFEIGLPVTTAEASFACPACEASLSTRLTMALSGTTHSPNQKYSVSVPETWQVTFPSALNPESNTVLSAVPVDSTIARRFLVTRNPLLAEETLQDVIDLQLAALEFMGDSGELYYSGPSLFLLNGYDMVYAVRETDSPAQASYQWHRFVQYDNVVYTLQYSSSLVVADADSEAIDQLMRSFSVDIRIPD